MGIFFYLGDESVVRRRSSGKERNVEEVGGIVKKECGIAMVYGGVWDRRIVRCLVFCVGCLSGQL